MSDVESIWSDVLRKLSLLMMCADTSSDIYWAFHNVLIWEIIYSGVNKDRSKSVHTWGRYAFLFVWWIILDFLDSCWPCSVTSGNSWRCNYSVLVTIMDADDLVLKHQAISIPNDNTTAIMSNWYHQEWLFLVRTNFGTFFFILKKSDPII